MPVNTENNPIDNYIASLRTRREVAENRVLLSQISGMEINVSDIIILAETYSRESNISIETAREIILEHINGGTLERLPTHIVSDYVGMVLARNRNQSQLHSPRGTSVGASPTPHRENNCRRCHENFIFSDNRDEISSGLCSECYHESLVACDNCRREVTHGVNGHEIHTVDGQNYCHDCFRNNFYFCDTCGSMNRQSEAIVCDNCHNNLCPTHRAFHRCLSEFIYRPFHCGVLVGKEKPKHLTTDRIVGVELEVVNGNPNKVPKPLPKFCGIAQDGSLKGSNPIEIQTPPSSGSMLETLLLDTEATLKEAKYEVNKSCGVHIHFDATDFKGNAKKIRQILNTYYAIEPVIFAMLPKSRRNNQYAMPLTNWLSPAKISEILATKRISMPKIETEWYKTKDRGDLRHMKSHKYDSSRYHGLNLHNLFMGKSLELRYHHGSISAKEIINWINFNAKILDWALVKYSNEKLINIINSKKVVDKLRKIVSYLELDKTTERYVRKNIIKNSK